MKRRALLASEADGPVFGASESDPDAGVRDSANLVMYEEPTESRWSQVLAEAICGPRAGESLGMLPSTVTTWGEWRSAHPDSGDLLPPLLSGRWTAKRAEGR